VTHRAEILDMVLLGLSIGGKNGECLLPDRLYPAT
jgi:hypothetical protein